MRPVPVQRSWKAIWVIDFEFSALRGDRPRPVCLSALDVVSGRRVSSWLYDGAPPVPPFTIDGDVLVVAFFGTAEIGCFEALGWPAPSNLIDLFAEFHVVTNGHVYTGGYSLLAALRAYNIVHYVEEVEKDRMRDLAIRGGPYTDTERAQLMAYCDSDIDATAQLWTAMAPAIDEPRALFRGRYVCALGRMEHLGVPIDVEAHDVLASNWDRVRWGVAWSAGRLHGGVYGNDGAFREDRFAEYLKRRQISWPLTKTGHLKDDRDTWSDMARVHPVLADLHEAHKTREIQSLTKVDADGVRRPKFATGLDGRNRAILGPWGTKTGRSQPSPARLVFASARWLRGGLIRPPPGRALAYIDWTAAEIGIAAALSRDANMMAAYRSGDVYFHFAKLAGRVPRDAVRADHEDVRTRFKLVVLAVGYGQGAESLARVLGIQTAYAQELLELHRRTFPAYWRWSDSVSATARGTLVLRTRLGWPLHVTAWSNKDRSLRNFAVQATCAEVLRVATVLAVERRIGVLASLHDAFLIEADADAIDHEVERMRGAMADASRTLLDGFELATTVHGPIHHPDRLDPTPTWGRVMSMLKRKL